MKPEFETLLVQVLNNQSVIHGWAKVSLADPLLQPSQHNHMSIIRHHSLQAAQQVQDYMISSLPD